MPLGNIFIMYLWFVVAQGRIPQIMTDLPLVYVEARNSVGSMCTLPAVVVPLVQPMTPTALGKIGIAGNTSYCTSKLHLLTSVVPPL